MKDVNDNIPRFLDTPYTGTVLENASLGMTVMRVTAVDRDEVINKKIRSSDIAVWYCQLVELSNLRI